MTIKTPYAKQLSARQIIRAESERIERMAITAVSNTATIPKTADANTDTGGSNIVVINSEIHHNQGNDRHGIGGSSGADGLWILNNYIHHNGGDGFQACHGCSTNPPRNIYIGGNLFHSDRENAVDLKYAENIIIENNIMHSLVSAPRDVLWCFDDGSSCKVFTSGSDGSAIVIGSDGGPSNVIVKGNGIYDTVNAVRIERGTAISILDNTLHDLSSNCLALEKDGLNTLFRGNSCSNANRGIFQFWRVNFSLAVENNLFQNLATASIEYESQTVADASTLLNNQFIGTGPVIYNKTIAGTQAEINALPGSSGNTVN